MAQALGGHRRAHPRRLLYYLRAAAGERVVLQGRLPADRRVGDDDLEEPPARLLRAHLRWPTLRGSRLLPDPPHGRRRAAREARADGGDHSRLRGLRGCAPRPHTFAFWRARFLDLQYEITPHQPRASAV